jgi:hypothetical protein
MVAGHRPAGGGGGLGQSQVRFHAGGAALWVRAETGDHPSAGGGLLDRPAQGQGGHQLEFRLYLEC